MICERCGRLLNRATGKCNVCADHGGAAPPPIATTEAAAGPEGPEAPPVAPPAPRPPRLDPGERPSSGYEFSLAPSRVDPPPATPKRPDPPDERPAGMVGPGDRSIAATLRPVTPTPPPGAAPPAAPAVPTPAPPPVPEPDAPISVSAAVAILDISDKQDRAKRPPRSATPPPPVEPAEPPPPPRAPGAPVGVIRAGRLGRRKVDLVAYDGNLVIAKRGAPENLTSGQLAAQDPSSRILAADAVEEALVREDAVSGGARIKLRTGEELVLRWPGWKNRGFSAENLLAHSFPGKVDLGSPEIAKRTIRVMAGLGGAILAAVVLYLGLSTLLKGDPPPPPPPAPTTTLAQPEQAARGALQQACPAWQQFAGGVAPGDRPDPGAMRPVVDGMKPSFDAAANAGADPVYATARDEVAYLQEYARRPVADVARESVSRVAFAMRTVSTVCDRAMG